MEKEILYYRGDQVTLEEWAVIKLFNLMSLHNESIPNHISEAHDVMLKDIEDRKNRPEVGDICAFWNNETGSVVICKFLGHAKNSNYPYRNKNDIGYRYCKKVTDQSIVDLYNKIKES